MRGRRLVFREETDFVEKLPRTGTGLETIRRIKRIAPVPPWANSAA